MPIPNAVLIMDSVYHRIPPLTAAEALARLDRIERRDLTALAGLQGLGYLDPTRIFREEWGVAKEARFDHPDCILISGGGGAVHWGAYLDAGLIPIAHSHPFHRNSPGTTRALGGAGGIVWGDINGQNPNQDLAERLKVFPSAGDVAFCANNNLAVHIVKTPYCYVVSGVGIPWVVNHDAAAQFAIAPRLEFRIFNVRRVNEGHHRTHLAAVVNHQDVWNKRDIDVFGGGAAGLHF